jgi:hypothetical protein
MSEREIDRKILRYLADQDWPVTTHRHILILKMIQKNEIAKI